MSQIWEVAGKKPKQKNVSNGSLKANTNDKMSNTKPVETQTLFEAFNKPSKNSTKEVVKEEEIKKKKVAKVTTNKPKTPQLAPKSLNTALTNFDCDELMRVYENDQEVFPSNPIIWLKDLATYISKKLEVQQIVSLTYSEFSPGFPLIVFVCQKQISNVLKGCGTEVLKTFVEDYFDMILKDANKDNLIHGYKLLVQAILRQHPEFILDDADKMLSLLKSYQNKPQICLVLIWTIGQAGSNVQTRFKVWAKIMLPYITSSNLSKYIFKYIEDIFSECSDRKQLAGLLGYNNFFTLFDNLFLHESSNIREESRHRLMKLYPDLKAIVFNPSLKNNVQNYFSALLVRLKDANPGDHLHDEIMELLLNCLKLDKDCFGRWKDDHLKSLHQSCSFLQYIHSNWNRVSRIKGLDTKLLLRTIDSLKMDSKGMAEKAYVVNKKSVEKCNNYIKLLKKKRSGGFLRMFIINFFLFLTVGMALLFYDTKRSDPENSFVLKFYRKMEELGWMKYIDQAQLYTDRYTEKIMDGVRIGQAYYDKNWKDQIDPHVEKWSRVTKERALKIYQDLTPLMMQCKELAQVYLLKLQETSNFVYEKLKPCCDHKFVGLIRDQSLAYFDEFQKFIRVLVKKL